MLFTLYQKTSCVVIIAEPSARFIGDVYYCNNNKNINYSASIFEPRYKLRLIFQDEWRAHFPTYIPVNVSSYINKRTITTKESKRKVSE